MKLSPSELEYLSFVIKSDIETMEEIIRLDSGETELEQELELATAKKLLNRIMERV